MDAVNLKTRIDPSPDHSIIMLPSQDIHDSILNELPEEIRSEIIEAKKKQQNSSTNKSKLQVKINEDENINSEMNEQANIASNTLQSGSNSLEESSNKNINKNVEHLTAHPNSSTSAGCSNLVLSQDIDENTLNELPSNIRTEVINTMLKGKSMSGNKKKTTKNIQTCQEQFFKKTKPSSQKLTKTELPPIQEIDMSVLLELPEDIRNEIFNQYKNGKTQNTDAANRNISSEQQNQRVSVKNTTGFIEQKAITENISFSQVDPEFLEALPTDMRYDVKQYCMAKKKENQKKDNLTNKNCHTVANNSAKKWTVLQYDKNAKPLSKSKSNGKNSKAVTNKNNRKKDAKPTLKPKERVNAHELETVKKNDNLPKIKSDNENINVIKPSTSNLINTDFRNNNLDENEAILAHNINVINSDQNTEKYQSSLINIVHHFFSLPIEQVKMQIQMWISVSDIVNEVDFASLATFLSMLPEKKRIEDLYIILKTMHRCATKTGNCNWHKIYMKILKHVQHYMQIEYNSDLMVPLIKCTCS